MAKLSLAQFFVAALVFSGYLSFGEVGPESPCLEITDDPQCYNLICEKKCRSDHGDSFQQAYGAISSIGSGLACHCYYFC
ncbi:hypothetical protein ACJRO7_002119 [Eucalyptus globulus]|uniref:Uncharacterized protein n=1 Tax=Eucalyptus globulus TaxID=34317 RepID=A0ABD3LYF7_EUCGL